MIFNRWCKRNSIECNALKEWKLSIFNIVDKRISFHSIQLTCVHIILVRFAEWPSFGKELLTRLIMFSLKLDYL